MTSTLSPMQEKAYDEICRWKTSGSNKEFVLAGYAGTGKSTLAYAINEATGRNAHFLAYTGKAAHVLRTKGCDAATIHSALYKPAKPETLQEIQFQLAMATSKKDYPLIKMLENKIKKAMQGKDSPNFKLNYASDIEGAFVIVDEYSMLPKEIINDLRKVANKILYLGDPKQLPPVNGRCILEPDFFLTEIHRQALESPIIRIATEIREGNSLGFMNEPGFLYAPKKEIKIESYADSEQIIVGKNDTRNKINQWFRRGRGIKWDGLPQKGEK